MDLDLYSLLISDLVINSSWNSEGLHNLFRDNLNSLVLNLGQVGPTDGNTWVWYPNSNRNKLVVAIFSFLDCGNITCNY